MNKKVLIACIIVLIVICSIVVIYKTIGTNPENINVIKYQKLTDKVLKKINITSGSEISELEGYIKDLKPLTASEMVDLDILTEVEINYNDTVAINIQIGETDYCYYTNKDENFSGLSKMPNGLYDWAIEKTK